MPKLKNLGSAFVAEDDDVPAIKPRSKRATQSTEPTATASPLEKTVTIVLEENDNIPPTGQFFSVNGRTFILRPGDEAVVPLAIINILNDAVQAVPQIDQSTKQVIGYRSKLRFPYRVVQREAA